MDLLVIPLHGRGNQGGEGVGVNTYLYRRGEVPSSPWALELVSSQLHMTHNADPVDWEIARAQPREDLFPQRDVHVDFPAPIDVRLSDPNHVATKLHKPHGDGAVA